MDPEEQTLPSENPGEGEQAEANARPEARLTADGGPLVFVGTTVHLDGSASFDPDNDPVTPSWSFVKPESSQATLTLTNFLTCEFTPDVAGTYTVTLIVEDDKNLKSEAASFPIETTVDPVTGHDLRANELSADGNADPGDTVFFDLEIMNLGDYFETIQVEITVSGPESSEALPPVSVGTIDAHTDLQVSQGDLSYTFPAHAAQGYYSFQARVFSDAGDENWQNNYSTTTVYVGDLQYIETNAYQYDYKLIYWDDSLSLPDEINAGGYGWLEYNGYTIAFSPNTTDDRTYIHIKNELGVTLASSERVYAGRCYLYDSGKLMVNYDMNAPTIEAMGIEVGMAVPGVVTITPETMTCEVGQSTTMEINLGVPGACCFNDDIYEYQSTLYFLIKNNSDYHNTVISANSRITDDGWDMDLTPLVAGTHQFVLELDGEGDAEFYVFGELIADTP
ncbi:PKD domain-containing protein [Desulfatiferula olefinivorans]